MKILSSVATLATFAAAFSLSQVAHAGNGCFVWDRYGGKLELARGAKYANLGGMRFPSTERCSEVWNTAGEFWTTKCTRSGGGPMDDKINGATVPPGCTLKVAEHPGFDGVSYMFVSGTWNDIQSRNVNDISSVKCDCSGDPTSEFVQPPIVIR